MLTPLRLLPLVLFLFAFECQMEVPGTVLPREDALYSEVYVLEDAWERRETLPPLTAACYRDAEEVVITQLGEQEFIDQARLCPMTDHGCSNIGVCAYKICATATFTYAFGHPTIYLSPGESADGHEVSVRHEMAHMFNGHTTGDWDSHTNPEVFGAMGVVWRPDL